MYGPAQVAVWIGQKDTVMIKLYIYSDRQIPDRHKPKIKEVYNDKRNN